MILFFSRGKLEYNLLTTWVSSEVPVTLQYAGSGFGALRSVRMAQRALHHRAIKKTTTHTHTHINRLPAVNYLFFSRALRKFFPNGAMILEREETEATTRSASKCPHGSRAGEVLGSCGGVPPATTSVPIPSPLHREECFRSSLPFHGQSLPPFTRKTNSWNAGGESPWILESLKRKQNTQLKGLKFNHVIVISLTVLWVNSHF